MNFALPNLTGRQGNIHHLVNFNPAPADSTSIKAVYHQTVAETRNASVPK
jgi:hypothetical protein